MRFQPRQALAASLALLGSSVLFQGVAAVDKESDVITLTKDTFKAQVEPEALMLVEFFAPCGHCKALAPHYEEAATILKNDSIKVAKVDCTEETDLCTEQGVAGYPTLKVFRKGQSTDYQGPRKTDGIVHYMKKQALPAVSEVTLDNFETFQKDDPVVVVGFFEESDKAHQKVLSEVADKLRDEYLFGQATDAEVLKKAEVTAPAIVVFKSFDEGKVPLKDSITAENIEAFIKAESLPLVDEVGAHNFAKYAQAKVPLAYLFIDPESADKEALIESLRKVAAEQKGKMNFVWIDAKKFAQHAQALNIKGTEWPAFAIQEIEANAKYPLKGAEITPSNVVEVVTAYVNKYNAKELQPDVKSQEVPEKQDGPVYVLVADNFEEVVFDDKKDALVEFYAPWCGHCKRLAPTWDELGEKYADHKDKILIAKMDATENDVPPSAGFSVSSFPTIKFKPAGSRKLEDYNGGRDLEDFVSFLETKMVNKVELAPKEEKKEEEKAAAEPVKEAAEEVVGEATEKVKEATGEAEKKSKHDEL